MKQSSSPDKFRGQNSQANGDDHHRWPGQHQHSNTDEQHSEAHYYDDQSSGLPKSSEKNVAKKGHYRFFFPLGGLKAGVDVAALLTAEAEHLSVKRGPDGVSLKHKAAALGVLDQEHALLLLFLFFVPTGKGRGQKETAHAGEDQPDGNGEQQEAQEPSHDYCPPGFWR